MWNAQTFRHLHDGRNSVKKELDGIVGTNTCSAKTNLEIVGIQKVEKSSVERITFARMTIGRLNHQKYKYQLYLTGYRLGSTPVYFVTMRI